ncbi:hypothetical protein JB92DRAFT_2836511 [Gautieria morchelliformis]|nr:hypothetical protein JB92DRAFT_2836511 [Gautieria morchelliformis]
MRHQPAGARAPHGASSRDLGAGRGWQGRQELATSRWRAERSGSNEKLRRTEEARKTHAETDRTSLIRSCTAPRQRHTLVKCISPRCRREILYGGMRAISWTMGSAWGPALREHGRFHNYPGRPRCRRGGTQGIGEGIACRFAQAGAEVWILGRNEAKGNLAGERARCCPEHHFINADFSLFAEAKRVAHDIRTRADPAGSTNSSCVKHAARETLIMDTFIDAGVPLDADVQPDLEEGQLTRRRPLRGYCCIPVPAFWCPLDIYLEWRLALK